VHESRSGRYFSRARSATVIIKPATARLLGARYIEKKPKPLPQTDVNRRSAKRDDAKRKPRLPQRVLRGAKELRAAN
jgi:hypothetical protein